jgi:small subunit ribosomal protein S15
MALTPEVKKEIIAKYGSSATDTGSPEAQVALLSRRIEDITTHLKTNPHDHHNRRGLLLLVGQRRRILQYLAKTDINRYLFIFLKSKYAVLGRKVGSHTETRLEHQRPRG